MAKTSFNSCQYLMFFRIACTSSINSREVVRDGFQKGSGRRLCPCLPPMVHDGIETLKCLICSCRIETTSCGVNAEGHLNARVIVEVVTTFSSFQVL